MDLILVMLVLVLGGMWKVRQTGGWTEGKPPVMEQDGTVHYFNAESIPIGSNLYLKRETAPFTKILKQLGLMR